MKTALLVGGNLVLCAAVGFFVWLRLVDARLQDANWGDRAVSAATYLAASARGGLQFEDQHAIEEAVRTAAAPAAVGWARVRDARGVVRALGGRGRANAPIDAPPVAGVTWHGRWQIASAPVRGEDGQPLGTAEIAFNRSEQLGRRHLVDGFNAGFLLLLFAGAGAVAYAVRVGRQLQDKLVHSDRLASLGRLAASVAHEINNPLVYILGNLSYGIAELAHPLDEARRAELCTALAEAKMGAERVQRIVADLRAHARSDDAELGPVDVARAFESALNIMGSLLRQRARVVRELGEVPPVRAAEHRLVQVLVNLLSNAAQALPDDGGVIRLRCAQDGAWVRIAVEDNGSGIPADVLRRIFEPFFTTKAQGEGTGLGLSLCDGIIRSFGGHIEVTSTPGAGSTFTVVLPAAESRPAPTKQSTAAAAPPRARVLIVDDEEPLTRALARELGRHHEVVTALGGARALELLSRDGTFDAVLCDLMMPGTTGMALFGEIARTAPGLTRRFVFMSGGAFTDEARAFLARVDNVRLEKPLDLDALSRLLGTFAPPPRTGRTGPRTAA